MNAETVTEIITQLNDLSDKVDKMSQIVNALKIDSQYYIKNDISMTPAVATKVGFNQYGVIVSADKLSSTDIPSLGIDKIDGLRKELDSKANSSEINKQDPEVLLKKGAPIATACKVNYDSHGFIVSGSNLCTEDIPELPIEKIEGLQSVLDSLSSSPMTVTESSTAEVSVQTDKYVTEEAVHSLKSMINEVESRMCDFATQQSLQGTNQMLQSKVDSNPAIVPGVYTKVSVDSKGLITSGSSLTVSDLPSINISDIVNLSEELNKKVNVERFNQLTDELTTYMSSLSISKIRSEMSEMIEKRLMNVNHDSIENHISELSSRLDSVIPSLSTEEYVSQLKSIESSLSELSGRISVLEKKYESIK